jgi:hypothetical protein
VPGVLEPDADARKFIGNCPELRLSARHSSVRIHIP